MSEAEYRARCKAWYSNSRALADALNNFRDFDSNEDLKGALRRFWRNPSQKDLIGSHHNPTRNLIDFLWGLQVSLRPGKCRLDPLLDFEERYQTIFLRRGLIIYCKLFLREAARPQEDDPQQVPLPLDD